MSLDVYLYGDEIEEDCDCPYCDNKHRRKTRLQFYSANITHNLGRMAREAGIYHELWRPEEICIEKAWQLVEPLRNAEALLISDPERFKQFNPLNGWGDYEGLVSFVAMYREACEKYPDATVEARR